MTCYLSTKIQSTKINDEYHHIFQVIKTQYFKIDGVLYSLDIEGHGRTSSLEVQWTGICLPMQGTWVQSLVRKDSTCCRTMKPASCNF